MQAVKDDFIKSFVGKVGWYFRYHHTLQALMWWRENYESIVALINHYRTEKKYSMQNSTLMLFLFVSQFHFANIT